MQPCIDAKVCNLLGDERMSTFECDCGNVMPRYASHRPELIGMECSVCQTKWKTHAVKDENGQTKLMNKRLFVRSVISIILMIALLMDARSMIAHATVAKPCDRLKKLKIEKFL